MSIFIVHPDTTGWDAQAPVLTEPEDDFDILQLYPVVQAASLKAALALYARGDELSSPYTNMFVVDAKGAPLVCSSGFYALEVTAKGIAHARDAKYQIDSYANRNSYKLVQGGAYPTPAPYDISEPQLGLTVRYITSSRPDTGDVGKNITPPLSLDTPESIWVEITDTVFAEPSGWVLEKRTGPNIPGTEFWAITDNYVYYQETRPNS